MNTAIKGMKFLIHAAVWMNLENMVSGMSHKGQLLHNSNYATYLE
jgi:2-oxoglutarate dehydrogenase complex dehydrogenase (E1) component-like enzyme